MLPTVIALAGIPGAGKTAVAAHLSMRTALHILSRDALKRNLFGKDDYGDDKNELVFRFMLCGLPLLLRDSSLVIIDGMTFRRVGDMERLEEVLFSLANLLICYLEVTPDVAAARLEAPDQSAPSNRDRKLVGTVANSYRVIPGHWMRFDGSQRPESTTGIILSELISRGWLKQ